MLPRQFSLPTLTMPYMPRTPAKESYTLEDFQCKYCHRPFFSKRELSKHTESVHFMEVYKPSHWCSVCTSSFPSNKDLIKHMQSFHGEMSPDGGTTCKLCFLKFQHPRLLSSHMTMYHVPFTECLYCTKIFSDISSLWKHLLCKHKAEPKEVRCNLCDEVSGSPDDYDRHCKDAHAFPCMLCDTSTETREQLQDHLGENHNKHYCTDCCDIFNDFEGFVQHYITNEKCSLDPFKLICRYCGGVFSNLKLLFRHLCLDSFVCIFCSSSSISCKTFQSHLEESHNTKLTYSTPKDRNDEQDRPDPGASNNHVKVSLHRLTPTVTSEPLDAFMNVESNGNTASYIHNLIQVNENLLNSKPTILSKYPSVSSDAGGPHPANLLKLCNTAELMTYLQLHTMQSIALSSAEKTESDMDYSEDPPAPSENEAKRGPSPLPYRQMTKRDSSDSLGDVKPNLLHRVSNPSLSPNSVQFNHESLSSLELEDEDGREGGSDKGDTDDQGDAEPESSRRNSLRLKYQQLSISRKTGRSSKSLNKMLSKKSVEEITDGSRFSCQRCNKTFVSRSLLSRHWGTATKCYICSLSMCDLKVLNEHMKSAHSEYSGQ